MHPSVPDLPNITRFGAVRAKTHPQAASGRRQIARLSSGGQSARVRSGACRQATNLTPSDYVTLLWRAI